MSLHARMGISKANYLTLLVECGLFRKRSDGYRVCEPGWMRLLGQPELSGAELTQVKPRGSPGVRWFLRLGPKQDGYHAGTASQVNASVFVPPRTVGLASARRRLREVCFGFTDCTGT